MWSHPIFLDMTGDGKKGQINKMASLCLLVQRRVFKKVAPRKVLRLSRFLIFLVYVDSSFIYMFIMMI